MKFKYKTSQLAVMSALLGTILVGCNSGVSATPEAAPKNTVKASDAPQDAGVLLGGDVIRYTKSNGAVDYYVLHNNYQFIPKDVHAEMGAQSLEVKYTQTSSVAKKTNGMSISGAFGLDLVGDKWDLALDVNGGYTSKDEQGTLAYSQTVQGWWEINTALVSGLTPTELTDPKAKVNGYVSQMKRGIYSNLTYEIRAANQEVLENITAGGQVNFASTMALKKVDLKGEFAKITEDVLKDLSIEIKFSQYGGLPNDFYSYVAAMPASYGKVDVNDKQEEYGSGTLTIQACSGGKLDTEQGRDTCQKVINYLSQYQENPEWGYKSQLERMGILDTKGVTKKDVTLAVANQLFGKLNNPSNIGTALFKGKSDLPTSPNVSGEMTKVNNTFRDTTSFYSRLSAISGCLNKYSVPIQAGADSSTIKGYLDQLKTYATDLEGSPDNIDPSTLAEVTTNMTKMQEKLEKSWLNSFVIDDISNSKEAYFVPLSDKATSFQLATQEGSSFWHAKYVKVGSKIYPASYVNPTTYAPTNTTELKKLAANNPDGKLYYLSGTECDVSSDYILCENTVLHTVDKNGEHTAEDTSMVAIGVTSGALCNIQ